MTEIQMSAEQLADFVLAYLKMRGETETKGLIIDILTRAYNNGVHDAQEKAKQP